ncbi:hypothetical protein, partial [Lacticaseibacillus pantheris]|uniref:hypothetical protein n=1 Tax=Lacticaseibacillus pantheris TaxID=171523 RepID=UPI001CDAD302
RGDTGFGRLVRVAYTSLSGLRSSSQYARVAREHSSILGLSRGDTGFGLLVRVAYAASSGLRSSFQ